MKFLLLFEKYKEDYAKKSKEIKKHRKENKITDEEKKAIEDLSAKYDLGLKQSDIE
ncbi:hypothetical protein [Taibaiella lutea]|uniref:hypothetical protein n=1 Tax=Taibaiella lutea TaxID=2608001 RepID=UPI00167FE2D7|nr:hypothetical protein [Taibaiella lutea]